MTDLVKLLGYLKKLTPGQFSEVVFFLNEKKLIDQTFLSSPFVPASNAIEVINLLKQKPDGSRQLVRYLKEDLAQTLDPDLESELDFTKEVQLEKSQELQKELEEIIKIGLNILKEGMILSAYHLALRKQRIVESAWQSEPEKIIEHLQNSAMSETINSFTPSQRFGAFLYVIVKKQVASEVSADAVLEEIEDKLFKWLGRSNMNNLLKEIETDTSPKSSCLLVRIYENKQEKNYYNIDAWFIEDWRSYRDLPKIMPRQIWKEEESRHEGEIEKFIRSIRDKCYECSDISELPIHIFLPMKLMKLDIGAWPLKEGRARRLFGAEHEILLHSEDRLDPVYKSFKEAKRKRWEQVENTPPDNPLSIFEEVAFYESDALYKKGQLSHVVGIKLLQPLCLLQENNQIDDLLEELILDSPIPLALWMREAVTKDDLNRELENMFKEGCQLEKLASKIKEKRLAEPSMNISLLWDDPKLLPPQQKENKDILW
jgi:hypothetical protein